MPGPNDQPIAPSAPAPDVVPVAVAAAPIPEPAAPAQPDQVVVAQPAPAVAVVSEPAGAAPVAPTHEPTLIDKFEAKEAAAVVPPADPAAPKPEDKPADKPAEAAPVVEAKAADPAAPAVDPAAPPLAVELAPIDYFAAETGIKLPETIQLDDAGRKDLTTALDAFRTDPIKGAQALIDMHNTYMARADEKRVADQWAEWHKTNDDWTKLVMADPILGGAGHDTAMASIARVREALGSNAPRGSDQWKQDIDELRTAMRVTGAGNSLPILRLIHNASRFIREARPAVVNGGVPKTNGQAPNKGRGLVYTNPTSQT